MSLVSVGRRVAAPNRATRCLSIRRSSASERFRLKIPLDSLAQRRRAERRRGLGQNALGQLGPCILFGPVGGVLPLLLPVDLERVAPGDLADLVARRAAAQPGALLNSGHQDLLVLVSVDFLA